MSKKLGILLAREDALIERSEDGDRSNEFFDGFFDLTLEIIGAAAEADYTNDCIMTRGEIIEEAVRKWRARRRKEGRGE